MTTSATNIFTEKSVSSLSLTHGVFDMLPWLLLAFCVIGFTFYIKSHFSWIRTITVCIFLLLIAEPYIQKENRLSTPSITVIAIDESQSMLYNNRSSTAESHLQKLLKEIEKKPHIEALVLRVASQDQGNKKTNLFKAVEAALKDIPKTKLNSILVLSDGQIHDVPASAFHWNDMPPLHAFIVGEPNEIDRQLIFTNAPSYGVVGESVEIAFKVIDHGSTQKTFTTVMVSMPNGETKRIPVRIGTESTLSIPIENAGQNVVSLDVEKINSEITTANNKAVLSINGVRDRLRVLLISGSANISGRTWRGFLKSDPAVDLVHFTILRQPQKIDVTPRREMSLIVFPFKELFEEKIESFDLIIFDHYSLSNILPAFYLENIGAYVRNGGGLIVASGPSYAQSASIYNSPLKDILPAKPAGSIIEKAYIPELSDLGKIHPVTLPLYEMLQDDPSKKWAPWMRQIPVSTTRGQTLMTGINNLPLITLSREGKGRVGFIASDQIWLWSRGYSNAGPYTSLLKRLVHWVMKEPELDERALIIAVSGQTITIKKRALEEKSLNLTITTPEGQIENVTALPNEENTFLETEYKAAVPGIYQIDDTVNKRPVVVGDATTSEILDARATQEKLKPFINAHYGSLRWINDTSPAPALYFKTMKERLAGKNWIGIKDSSSHIVTGVHNTALPPAFIALIGLCLCVLLSWWTERKTRS